jgi:hypothetical protein
MAADRGESFYSVGLLRQVAAWSVPVAIAAAVIGSVIAHDVRFGISCLIGAALDVGTLHGVLGRVRDAESHEFSASGSLTSFFLFRLLAKSALLVVAALLPQLFSLLGMAAGVLVVDLTLVTAGSAAAAWRTFRPHGSSG